MMPETARTPPFDQTRWSFFFALAAVEGLGTLAWLVSIPGEIGAAGLWGLSAARLTLALLPAVVLALSLAALAAIADGRGAALHLKKGLALIENRHSLPAWMAWLGGLVVCVFLNLQPGISIQAAGRLLPAVVFVTAVLLEAAACLALAHSEPIALRRAPWRRFGAAATLAGALAFIAGLNGLLAREAEQSLRYMNHAGAPVLPYQLYTALFAGLTLHLAVVQKPRLRLGHAAVDAVLFLALTATAAVLWLRTPPVQTNFSHLTGLPNLAYAPFSDARLYDLNAQALLAGEGLAYGQPLPRPLYTAFLALLHTFAGQDYYALVNAQTLVLALFPALVYLLGARLGSRPAGTGAALLVIFRETNQSLLSASFTLSSVRLLLTEVFTAGLLALACLLALRWLALRQSPAAALLAGGGLGLAVLARSQVLALLPAVLLLAAPVYRRRPGQRAAAGLAFVLGAALVVTPWMARNAAAGGQFVPESAGSGGDVLKVAGEITAGTEAGGSPGAARVLAVVQKTALQMGSNLASTFAQLPYRLAGNQALEDYYTPTPFVELAPGEASWAALNLLVLAAGVLGAYKMVGWGGLLPLAAYAAYGLSGALLNFSGWRFIQPVDWAAPLYFSLGVAWLAGGDDTLLSPGTVTNGEAHDRPGAILLTAGLALTLGLLLPIGERLAAPRSRVTATADLNAEILSAANRKGDPARADALARFTARPGAVLFAARGLYPDNFEHQDDSAKSEDYLPLRGLEPGLAFNAVGAEPAGQLTFLALQAQVRYFPNGADVIAAGCRARGYFRAYAVLVQGKREMLYLADEIPDACPPP